MNKFNCPVQNSKYKNIRLGHGSGGKLTHELVEGIFLPFLANSELAKLEDAAKFVTNSSTNLAFTTDAFVVKPIFFPGGDIGKLAACGTFNDLAALAARPKYISACFILEEGLALSELELIVQSFSAELIAADVQLLAADTKVVNKGAGDKIFISCSALGFVEPSLQEIGINKIQAGDKIIVSGPLGLHGMAIMASREELELEANIESDCCNLYPLVSTLFNPEISLGLRFMRDITRGGLATVLNEIARKNNFGINIIESMIPVSVDVQAICEILGFDPLYVACEGRILLIVQTNFAEITLAKLKEHPLGYESAIIGEVTNNNPGMVCLETLIGGSRIVDMLTGEQLPRIC